MASLAILVTALLAPITLGVTENFASQNFASLNIPRKRQEEADMADVSQSSPTGGTAATPRSGRKRSKAHKATVTAEKDGKPDKAGLQQDSTTAPSTSTGERKRKKKSKQGLSGKTASGRAHTAAEASSNVAEEIEQSAPETTNTHKPHSKGKGKAENEESSDEQDEDSTLPFLRLSEPLGKSARLAPVFSNDGRFCFVAAASSVKIYLVSSCQLLSTIDLPALPRQAKETSSLYQPNNQVTSLFLNPTNSLQLITTSLDGFVRVWDYLEGRILYSADMGGPIPCAAMISSDSTAAQQSHLKETLFLAVNRGASVAHSTATSKGQNQPTSIVFCINLKRSEIKNQVRLGKCKEAIGLSVSHDGSSVVIIGRKKIHIAPISISKSGSITPKASLISFEGFPSTRHYTDVTFTTVACHPTESYFATGDTRGTIRLWYILNEESLKAIREAQEKRREGTKANKNVDVVPSGAMAVLHWHAHAVSSLAFTPNGAYLLSGGEEAVLVVWQIASRHKEFVPRIGAPIEALTIINGQSGQQEFVARLKDGSIVFLGAGTLKVLRTIAGVKTIEQFSQKEGSDLPLAIEPLTNRLVFQASHPSTIQFYSATQDMHIYEQDISPSNRVSRTDERPIEPVRVEQIAFCATSSSSSSHKGPVSSSANSAGALQVASSNEARGSVWMATFDTWQDRTYTRESHLKFWMGYPTYKPGYGLVSRIDNPHGTERISSMAFSPPPATSISKTSTNGGVGKLVTTSLDGTIKLWSYKVLQDENISKKNNNKKNLNTPQGIWQCLYSLSYRSYGAIESKFSNDGSLLAISHINSKITLWNTENGNLIKAFDISQDEIVGGGGEICDVAFAGRNGTRLIVGGKKGHVIFDLLTLEEIETLPIPALQIITSPPSSPSDTYMVISNKTSTTISLSDLSSIMAPTTTSSLPFSLAKATCYPYNSISSSNNNATSSLVTAAIAKSGQVALLGPIEALKQIRPVAFENQANLKAALNTSEISNEDLRPIRLFDELFGTGKVGKDDIDDNDNSAIAFPSEIVGGGRKKRDIFDEIPSHKLPSLSTSWRDLITPGLLPLADPSTSSSSIPGSSTLKNGESAVKDEEDSDEDEQDDNDDEDVEMGVQDDTKVEDDEFVAQDSKQENNITYVNLPEEELVEIFSKCINITSSNSASSPSKKDGSSVAAAQIPPSDRMAGKAGKDKNKKKRKSLLASMV